MSTQEEGKEKNVRRARNYFLFTLIFSLIILALSVNSIIGAMNTWSEGQGMELATLMTLLGFVGVFISYSMMSSAFKIRRNLAKKVDRIVSVEKCMSCDFKEQRAFAEGDHIYKTLGQCPKCSNQRYVSAVFLEKIRAKP